MKLRSIAVRLHQQFLLVLALALAIAIYFPGLSGSFIFDDGPNITKNQRLLTADSTFAGVRQAALSSDSGMLKRPISMLSFWANYHVHGLDPYFFKLTNLIIHLVNGIAIFLLCRFLLESPVLHSRFRDRTSTTVALAATTLWLVHPLNLTSVLYVVQRMTSLCAMFVLFGLFCYVLGRRHLVQGRTGFPLILAGMFGFGALAVLSKENGALLPFFVVVVELTLFRFAAADAATSRKLRFFISAIAVLPLVAVGAFLLTHPEWLENQYQTRNFSIAERMMTEARVLWLYLQWAVLPTPSALGLFHDDIPISEGLFRPPSTLLSIIALMLVMAAAIVFRRRLPLISFAVLWYFVGHALESSFIGLELVHEHRNYLPIVGPLLGAVGTVSCALSMRRRALRAATVIAVVLAFSFVTFNRAVSWGHEDRLRMTLVRHHPLSPRSNFEAATTLAEAAQRNPELLDVYEEQIRQHFDLSIDLDKTDVNGLFGLMLFEAWNGHPVDKDVLDRLERRLAQSPLRFTVVGAFRSLLDWMLKGVVKLPPDDVHALFEAALGNQTANQRTRATLLSLLSAYHFSITRDKQKAVSLALAAVEMDPEEPAHRLSLADLALKLGNSSLARTALEEAARYDRLGAFALHRRTLEQKLFEHLSKSGKTD